MSAYQESVSSFFSKNMTAEEGGYPLIFFPIVLPFQLAMAALRLSLVFTYLIIGILTLGKVDLNGKRNEKLEQKAKKKEEEKEFYFDPLVYLPTENKNNLSELDSLKSEVEEYFDDQISGDEQIIFAVSHKKMAAFFTTERILYKLESPKKMSVDMIFGIVKNSDVKKIEVKKTFTDGLDFMVNDEKIAHLSGAADVSDVDLDKLGRLFQVVSQRINS